MWKLPLWLMHISCLLADGEACWCRNITQGLVSDSAEHKVDFQGLVITLEMIPVNPE